MVQYYFEKQLLPGEDVKHYQLFAVIDELYYWKAEGAINLKLQSFTIQNLVTGFNSEEISEKYNKLPQTDIINLRSNLGSFAYFVERSVNGFKSYVMWIKPDEQANELPWEILLN